MSTNDDNNEDAKEAAQLGQVFAGPGARHDQKPFKFQKLSSSQYEKIQRAKKYAREQAIKSVFVKQTIAHQQLQMQNIYNSMQKQQAYSLMCRIYIGSINFEIKEDTVRQAFLPFGPMRSFHLAFDPVANKHKGFAFIEYEIPEAASLAVEQMNAVMLGGRNIKVGRPSNMPQAQTIIDNYILEAQKFHRIYVAAIHPNITEIDLKSVFEAFGRIVSCEMSKESTVPRRHRGYAFIEYENTQSANDAVTAMNLFDLGGQYIRVGKAVTPPNVDLTAFSTAPMPTATAVAAAAITAHLTALDAVSQPPENPEPAIVAPPSVVVPPSVVIPQLSSMASSSTQDSSTSLPDVVLGTIPYSPFYSMSDSGLACEANVTMSNPTYAVPQYAVPQMTDVGYTTQYQTRVMVLRNTVALEDLDDDLESEMADECSNYGQVKRVVIYPDHSRGDVKIFIEFSMPSETETAINHLNGRFFSGRKVSAEFYSEELYHNNNFSA